MPWIGYFDKMRRADAFCYLDDVQYKKNEWQNRNRIKGPQGAQWQTVPVMYRFPQKINEVRIDNRNRWKKKHLNALKIHYGKAAYFEKYIGFFEDVYARDWDYLYKLNMHVAEHLRDLLGISLERAVLASELHRGRDDGSGDATDRLVGICERLGGRTYLAGRDGANYMDLERFRKKGISVIFQEFSHPVYRQRHGEFQPNLSAVDLLFNCGPDSLDTIIKYNPS